MNAPEFCYEHFGRHFAPESRDAWASKAFFIRRPKEGAAAKKSAATRLSSAGLGVIITESYVLLKGATPPESWKSPIDIKVSDLNVPEFQHSFLFDPPKERWVGGTFSNAGLNPDALFLNMSRGEVSFMIDSGADRKVAYLETLERAADLWGDQPTKNIHLVRDAFSARNSGGVVSAAATEAWNSATPDARAAIALLAQRGQGVTIFRQYLEWRKSHV